MRQCLMLMAMAVAFICIGDDIPWRFDGDISRPASSERASAGLSVETFCMSERDGIIDMDFESPCFSIMISNVLDNFSSTPTGFFLLLK